MGTVVMIIYGEVTLPKRAEVRKGEKSGREGQKGRKSVIMMFLASLHTHTSRLLCYNRKF